MAPAMQTEILFGGDLMLGRGVNAALAELAPHQPWTDLLPLFHAADLRIVNLECALTTRRERWSGPPKVFYFRADPSAVGVLSAAGIDACSLANNHVLDQGVGGLLDTLAVLDEAGIAHAGAGRDLAEARRPVILAAGPIRVGLIAVTDNEPAFAATPTRPGTAFLPVSLEREVLERVERAIAAARDAGADLVVFSDHWGPNMVLRPPPRFRAFARAVIDRGADVFHGHSAHLFQGVEVYRDRPILYDTGDLLDDYAVDPRLRNDWSFLFRVTFFDGTLAALQLDPILLSYARTGRAQGEDRAAILERMRHLSAELGTRLEQRGARLELPGAGAPVYPT